MPETIGSYDQSLVESARRTEPVKPWPKLLESIFEDGESEGYLPLPPLGCDPYATLHQTARIIDEIPSEVRKGKFGRSIISGKDLPGNSFLMVQDEDGGIWRVVDAKRKGNDFFVKTPKEDKDKEPKHYKIAVINRDEHDYA